LKNTSSTEGKVPVLTKNLLKFFWKVGVNMLNKQKQFCSKVLSRDVVSVPDIRPGSSGLFSYSVSGRKPDIEKAGYSANWKIRKLSPKIILKCEF
jgi:hypothetical protein